MHLRIARWLTIFGIVACALIPLSALAHPSHSEAIQRPCELIQPGDDASPVKGQGSFFIAAGYLVFELSPMQDDESAGPQVISGAINLKQSTGSLFHAEAGPLANGVVTLAENSPEIVHMQPGVLAAWDSGYVLKVSGSPVNADGSPTQIVQQSTEAFSDSFMQISLIFFLSALGLGGLHALEPGHGKTVVAAYLVSTRGRKIDAVILGLVVTLTHTFSVILLAIAAKVASNRISLTEESLHGYLGLVAGLLILAVGVCMLLSRIRGGDLFHGHSHGPGAQSHSHVHESVMDFHDHSPVQTETHPHDHDNHHHDHHGHHVSNTTTKSGKLGYWKLFLLGVSGGLVPCPAAIAILLAAVATGRIEEGLTYILLFSIGLAAVLIAIGIAVVGAGKLAARFLDAKKFARKVSIASAGLISLIGLITVINSIRHWI